MGDDDKPGVTNGDDGDSGDEASTAPAGEADAVAQDENPVNDFNSQMPRRRYTATLGVDVSSFANDDSNYVPPPPVGGLASSKTWSAGALKPPPPAVLSSPTKRNPTLLSSTSAEYVTMTLPSSPSPPTKGDLVKQKFQPAYRRLLEMQLQQHLQQQERRQQQQQQTSCGGSGSDGGVDCRRKDRGAEESETSDTSNTTNSSVGGGGDCGVGAANNNVRRSKDFDRMAPIKVDSIDWVPPSSGTASLIEEVDEEDDDSDEEEEGSAASESIGIVPGCGFQVPYLPAGKASNNHGNNGSSPRNKKTPPSRQGINDDEDQVKTSSIIDKILNGDASYSSVDSEAVTASSTGVTTSDTSTVFIEL